jgi:hypothetical protein
MNLKGNDAWINFHHFSESIEQAVSVQNAKKKFLFIWRFPFIQFNFIFILKRDSAED